MDSGFRLKCTDDTVDILQSFVTALGSYYEGIMKNVSYTPAGPVQGAPNMDAVNLALHMLSESLAKLWPCVNQYVAVIGPTGCGKSTLLNVLAAMTCRTGESYLEGVKQGASRAVLRETARHQGDTTKHAGGNHVDVDSLDKEMAPGDPSDPQSVYMVSRGNEELDLCVPVDLDAESRSISGLLGMCCARNREAYMRKHLALYDRNPFLLFNGRMGDAGTTKVTAVQWGPQFACRIRWIEKRKLRKRLREFRKFTIDQNSKDEGRFNEYKELWERILSIVGRNVDSDKVPLPTEELIESTFTELMKVVPLGKTETIQTVATQGCVLDRLQVRNNIRRRIFEQKLGILCEELIIEAPIPSSEGGLSLLDVPGTNDPRFLNQRETRDAIYRTALILLVLDKSVLDEATMKVLEDSPILERMLVDDEPNCSLVVVGIAEKDTNRDQAAVDTIAGFDANNDLKNALKRILAKKAKSLITSRRLDKNVAKQRVESIFHGERFSVLPVLPLLCASLHISNSNHKLHRQFCESPGMPTCPLVMSDKERIKRCSQTNIPQLLEKIHSVRSPPTIDHLRSQLETARKLLEMLRQESTYDSTTVDFFKRELRHVRCAGSKLFSFVHLIPVPAVDLGWIHEVLNGCAEECLMPLSGDDMTFLSSKLGTKAAINTELYQLAPIIMRGFRPEVIGKIVHLLIQPTKEKATEFVNSISELLIQRLRGNERWRDTTMEQVSSTSIGACIALREEVEKRWEHSVHRILARYLYGGETGGLQKCIRDSLSKAYDKTIKSTLKDLLRHGSQEARVEALLKLLKQNKAGKQVQKIAEKEVEGNLLLFWSSALEAIEKEVPKMWKSWKQQLNLLIKSTEQALEKDKVTKEETVNPGDSDDQTEEKKLWKSLDKILSKQHALLQFMDTHSESEEPVNYGYSLLHSNPCYEHDFEFKVSMDRAKFKQALKVDTSNAQQGSESAQGQPSSCHMAPGGPQYGELTRQEALNRPFLPASQVKTNLVQGSPRCTEPGRVLGQPRRQGGQTLPSLTRMGSGELNLVLDSPRTPGGPTGPAVSLNRKNSLPHRQVIALTDVESHNLQLLSTTPKNFPKESSSKRRRRP